jgi:hypothetical protein
MVARPGRFELPTYSSGGCRSIQLSYGRVVQVYIGDFRPSIARRNAGGIRRAIKAARVTAERSLTRRDQHKTKDNLRENTGLAAPTAAFAAATATATRSLRLRTRFVHIDCAAADLRAIESGDCLFAFFCIRHFYKSESA